MSKVTSIVLCVPLCEEDESVTLPMINEFLLKDGDRTGLVDLGDVQEENQTLRVYGGSKCLSIDVYTGAFNHLDVEGFLLHLLALPWASRDEVGMMINLEHQDGVALLRPGVQSEVERYLLEYDVKKGTERT